MESKLTKRCPICTKDLPIVEFGICRSRSDQRNLYCKNCVNSRTTEHRKALKEYKTIRKQYQAQGLEYFDKKFAPDPHDKRTPVQKVLDAIRDGKRTQKEIAREARLSKDDLGDVLVHVILWTKQVRSKVVDGVRVYFENELPEKPRVNYPIAQSWHEVARKASEIEIKGERRSQKVA